MIRAELGEVAEFINGAAFKPEDWGEEGMRIIRIQNLNDPTKPYNRTSKDVAEKYLVHTGTLLVSWSASLGVFEWSETDTALLNQHIFKVIPDPKKVDQAYLRHMLENALVDMSRHHRGSTMVHVNRKEFLGTTIPLPPLEVQKRIAGILDQADALRLRRRRALNKLNTLGQAIFHEMFGDVTGNSNRWRVVSVGEVTDCIVPGRNKPKSFSGDIPWITTAELVHLGLTTRKESKFGLTREEILEAGARVIPPNSVVITCVGDLGVASIASDEMVINQQLHSFQCGSEILPEYLVRVLPQKKKWMLSRATQTTLPYMNKSTCNSIPVPLPPIDLQRRFSDRIRELGPTRGHCLESFDRLDALFESIQFRAFRGEL